MLIRDFNKTVHQIWFQKLDSGKVEGKIDNNDYRVMQRSWIYFCRDKGWKYKLWTESKVLDLITEHFPEYLDEYNSLDSVVKKVDCARLMILYVFGGLYVDMDTYVKRDIDYFMKLKVAMRDDYPYTNWHINPKMNLTDDYDLILGQEKTVYEYLYNKFGLLVPKLNNAIIFAKKEQELFLDIIKIGFERKHNSIMNSFGVHTFCLRVYQEMMKFVNGMLDTNDYDKTSKILTLPTVYFYEIDTEVDWYLEVGGDPKHKGSNLQYIVHTFAGDWDEGSYGDFLMKELPNENLEGKGIDEYEG